MSTSSGLFRLFAGLGLAAAAGWACSQPLAQPYLFKCVGGDGTVEFTDRACDAEMSAEPVPKPGDLGAAERKTQNDVRLQRDKALTRQYEADRQAEEEALRAAQARQHQIAAEIASRLARERNTRNAATTSILPASGCDLCRTPGDSWPGFIR